MFEVGAMTFGKCLSCDRNKPGKMTEFKIREIGRLPNGCPIAYGVCPKCQRRLMVIGKKFYDSSGGLKWKQ